jgi:hypothetical protein
MIEAIAPIMWPHVIPFIPTVKLFGCYKVLKRFIISPDAHDGICMS